MSYAHGTISIDERATSAIDGFVAGLEFAADELLSLPGAHTVPALDRLTPFTARAGHVAAVLTDILADPEYGVIATFKPDSSAWAVADELLSVYRRAASGDIPNGDQWTQGRRAADELLQVPARQGTWHEDCGARALRSCGSLSAIWLGYDGTRDSAMMVVEYAAAAYASRKTAEGAQPEDDDVRPELNGNSAAYYGWLANRLMALREQGE